jgi:hypothetical protein
VVAGFLTAHAAGLVAAPLSAAIQSGPWDGWCDPLAGPLAGLLGPSLGRCATTGGGGLLGSGALCNDGTGAVT